MGKDQLTLKHADSSKFHGKTKAENMVKFLVHNWFHLFERPLTEQRIANQLELLDDKIKILTSIGVFSGKIEFTQYLQENASTKAAYHLDDMNVYPCGVGLYTIQTSIAYQTIDKSGKTQSFTLGFEADVMKNDDLTFKFLRIRIKKIEETNIEFSEAYDANRSKALIHYCLGLIEYNITDPKTLSNCFSEEFEVYPLNYKTLNKKTQLISWIGKINELISKVTITPFNLQINRSTENELTLVFDLLFEGETDGKLTNSLSKNIWIIDDNPNNSLPKIKSIKVEKLEPIFI